MKKTLEISSELRLPLETQTRTLVVYGGKGKGKSNFGAVLCEEFHAAGLKFAVIDPLDVFWGLRHGKTSAEQGIDVVILGGPHGDLAIEAGAGSTTADFVVDEDASVIVVMRHASGKMWTGGERIRFMRDFARRLFERQGEKRIPIHLIVDEAGRFVPQQMPAKAVDIAECVGAIEELVEWGRNTGVGVTLITQRSARMNKSVSELAECMVAFQTAGPRSIGAVVDWFGEHVPKERQHELVAILRKLPVGRALIVSPEFLDFEGEAQIRHRRTFDSSATPKAGSRPAKPGGRKSIDLEAYRVKLGETIAKAEAEDPRALARRIRELEAQLAKPAKGQTILDDGGRRKWETERAGLERAHAQAFAQLRKRIETMTRKITAGIAVMQNTADAASKAARLFGDALRSDLEALATDPVWTGPPAAVPALVDERTRAIAAAARDAFPSMREVAEGLERVRTSVSGAMQPRNGTGTGRERSGNGDGPHEGTMPAGAIAVLSALAQLEAHGIDSAGAGRVAPLAGTRKSSSTWRGYLARLRKAGLVRDLAGGALQLTDDGRALARTGPRFDSLEALHRHWLEQVGTARKVLDGLLNAGGDGRTREDLAEYAGVSPSSSTWRGYLATLRRYGLVEDLPDGRIATSAVLFPPGLD